MSSPLVGYLLLALLFFHTFSAHAYTAISGGSKHSCAVQASGAVICWGDNDDEQSSPPSGNFSKVSTGSKHTCALQTSGAIRCWGNNDYEQATPPAGNFIDVSLGTLHSCGVKDDGSLACWGRDTYGQATPPSSGDFQQVSTGQAHSCALQTDGSVTCWGRDSVGQSQTVNGTFTQVVSGNDYNCALQTDGKAVCWGDDAADQATPPTDNFVQLTAGEFHACGLKDDGSVVCWGSNKFGETDPPAEIFSLIDAGQAHNCGLKKADGKAVCWGNDIYGQSSPPTVTGPVRSGFDSQELVAGQADDASVSAVELGFIAYLYGAQLSQTTLYDNGQLRFETSPNAETITIAPFAADADLRASGSIQYGQGSVDGRKAFAVTWRDIGRFYLDGSRQNTFQVVLIDRSDIQLGDLDVEFNYAQIQWEIGDPSCSTCPLKEPPWAGFKNRDQFPIKLPGSDIAGALLDGGANALAENSLNSTLVGRYVFEFRADPNDPNRPSVPALCTASGSNGEFLVPTDCANIQDAIDSAQNGDTVLVSPGTYAENISFKGKAITLKSSSGAELTIIDGGRPNDGTAVEQPVVSFTQNETRAAVLQGFTLRNGESSKGGGIAIQKASPTIRDNIITANYCQCGGNGIRVEAGSPLILNNIISDNHNADSSSGGDGGGGIAVIGAGATEIIGNQIINNTSLRHVNGGGIYLSNAGNPLVQNNYIFNNTAEEGAGLGVYNTASERIIQNLIVGNIFTGQDRTGGGIRLVVSSGSEVLLLNNSLVNNRFTDLNAQKEGLQLSANVNDDTTTQLRVVNNIIQGGNAVYCETSNVQFTNNNISAVTGACLDPSGSNGNISESTIFADGSGVDAMRLQAGTPELDAGLNAAPALPAQDFNGNPRISDDNGDGQAVVDMGAFEGTSKDTLSISLVGNGSGTVSADNGINCGNQCQADYATGSLITLTATPAQDAVFQGWGGACSGTDSRLQITLAQSMNCYASFNVQDNSSEADIFSFTPSDTLLLVNQTHDFSLNWSKAGAPKTMQLINATASLGTINPSVLITDAQGAVRFSVSSPVASTATLRFSDINGTVLQTLRLRYVKTLDNLAQLNVQISGSGQGVITSTNSGLQGSGIDCGTDCSEAYNLNSRITLSTRVTSSTARFLGWGGDCSSAGMNSSVQLLMDGDKTCSAEYEQVTGTIIETIAGSGVGGFAGDGGAALAAQLSLPTGLAIDSAGNIYLADVGNNRIRKITPQGVVSSVAGNGAGDFGGDGAQAVNAALNFPTDVVVDTDGNLYIADSRNNRVRKVAPSGIISTLAGTGVAGFSGDGAAATAAQLNRPTGLALDASGKLYIADSRNHRIRVVDNNGNISTLVGTGVAGFSGDGEAAATAQLSVPVSVTLDHAGYLYIVDQGNHRVRFVDLQGMIYSLAGNGTAGFSGDRGRAVDAQLNNPLDVVVDSGGQAYISDVFNHRIRRVANGVIDTVAGTGNGGYSGDGGPALLAELNQPWGLAVNADGQLLLSDLVNHVLRRVDTSVTVVSPPEPPTTQPNPPDPNNPDPNDPNTPPTADTVRLTLTLTGDGNGVVTAPSGQNNSIDCGTQCSALYDKDSQVALTANANVDSSFSGWAGDCQGTDNPLMLTLDAAKNCTAQFTLTPPSPYQTLRISLGGSGSGRVTASVGTGSGIDCGSVCEETYNTGRNIQVLASADNGSEFVGWRGDCGGVLTPLSLNMARSFACQAVFEVIPFSVAQGVIDTFAGNGTAGFSGDSGPARDAALKFPTALVMDAKQRLLIVDTLNNRIRAVQQNTINTLAGLGNSGFGGDGSTATQAQFDSPTSLSLSRTGDAYLADTNNHRIRRINALGNPSTLVGANDFIVSTVAGSGLLGFSGDNAAANLARLNMPYGVAVDRQGNLYIADSNNHRIRRVDSSGRITTFAGTGIAGFSGDGDFAALAQLNFPTALLFKTTGELLIADSGNHRVRQVDSFGKITTLAGSGASGFEQGSFAGDGSTASTARLNIPLGLALDDAGTLYIADSSNHRIRQVTPQGIISTLVGSGIPSFSGDGGAPAAATLNTPADVWVTSSGDLYIADSGNHRIRRVSKANPELSIGKFGLGKGTVTAAAGLGDGINCGTNCRENYKPGTVVTLQATPEAGSVLFGWQGCTPLPGNPNQVNLVIQNDRTCTAQFNLSGPAASCPTSGDINSACDALGLTLFSVNIGADGAVYSGTLAGTITSQGVVYDAQFAAGAVLDGGEVGGHLFGNASQPGLLSNVRVQAGSRLSNLILGANVILPDDVTIEPLIYLNSGSVPRQAGEHPDFTPLWNTLPHPCAGIEQSATIDVRGVIYADNESLLASINAIPAFSTANLRFIQESTYAYLQSDNNDMRLILRPISVHHRDFGMGQFLMDNQHNARFLTANGLDVKALPVLHDLCGFVDFLRTNNLTDLSIDDSGVMHQPFPGNAAVYARPSAYLKRLDNSEPLGLGSTLDDNGLSLLTWKQRSRDGSAVYEQALYPVAFDKAAMIEAATAAGAVLGFTTNGEITLRDGPHQLRWRLDYVVTQGDNPHGIFGVEPGAKPEETYLIYPSGERQLLYLLPF